MQRLRSLWKSYEGEKTYTLLVTLVVVNLLWGPFGNDHELLDQFNVWLVAAIVAALRHGMKTESRKVAEAAETSAIQWSERMKREVKGL